MMLLWRGKGEIAKRHAGENYVFPHENLACGYTGKGRLADINKIINKIEANL